MSFIVAIDGPAGSGKGTVTEIICKKMNFINISTGAAYRSVALATLQNNISDDDTDKIVDLLDKINIEFKREEGKDLVYLNGENVTTRIREKDVTSIVSKVSSIKEVRFKLNDLFKKAAQGKKVIMEGRDIGTYVFPHADVKIYLDASLEERAKRRIKQNEELGIKNLPFEEVKKEMQKRDESDKHKEIGALKRAEDSIYIDSSNMTIEEVADEIIDIINKKRT